MDGNRRLPLNGRMRAMALHTPLRLHTQTSEIARLSGLAILMTLAACEAVPLSGDPVVQDSAGVRIVKYPAVPAGLPVWRVSETPSTVIGTVHGEGPYVFGHVASVVERGDGSIVVADVQALDVRVFDRQGRHIWSAGGRGGGPGEFRGVARVFRLAADSVLVIDDRQGRGTVLDPSGGFARQFKLVPPSPDWGNPTIVGVFPKGQLVGRLRNAESEAVQPGRYRGSLRVALFSAEGTLIRSLVELPGNERFVSVPQSGWMEQGEAIWGRRTQVVVGGGAIAATSQDLFQIDRFDSTGDRDMIIRVDAPPLIADNGLRSRLAGGGLRVGLHLPDTLPAVGRIHLDSERRLWVEEYVPPRGGRAALWWIFAENGQAVAMAAGPADFSIHQIGADYVLGVALDSLKVPYVEVRQILRR